MRLYVLIMLTVLVTGCAEGPLWRTGKYVPWISQQWAEEEKIAETLFSKRQRLGETVDAVANKDASSQEPVAQQLLDIVKNDPIHLMKIEAARQLPKLSTESAVEALEIAALDAAPDVRLAAVAGLQVKAAPRSTPVLVRLAKTDGNLDVRIAATRALSAFEGTQEVLQALDHALLDSNPAIQAIAIASLEKVTKQNLERDVNVWKKYVAGQLGNSSQQTANAGAPPFK